MQHRANPITSARNLAPEVFRRWTVGAITVAVLGYATVAAQEVQAGGLDALMTSRHVVMAVVTALALIFATRVDEVLGCAATIAATWLEVHSAFFDATVFPSAGLLIPPVLVLAVGILFGTRVSLGVALASFVATYLSARLSPAAVQGFPAESTHWFVMYGISLLSVWTLMALGLSGLTRVIVAMETSRKELADTIQYAPDGILVLDQRGAVLLANPAAQRLLRAGPESLVGERFGHVIAPLVGDAAAPAALSDPSLWSAGEALLTFAGDPPTYVEASWRSMGDGRQQLLLRDVTLRVTAEERRIDMEAQLAHAHRMEAVGRLAGGLSHDFNNILTAVSGSAELLRRTRNEVEREELISEIIDARDRGTSLTRQLLSFARRDLHQPRVLDVAEAVRGMERLLRRVIGDRHQLILHLEADCRVSADPGQFEHALVNLVANARDAMPSGGDCTITVAAMRAPEGPCTIQLSVRDTGTGMADDVAARAFEPFFTTKARGRGTGLGLASVHAMVAKSNGHARIDSEPGAGTCITIELPAVVDAVSAMPVERAVTSITAGTQRILLAEDDSGTRRVVERILTDAGYSVHVCVDGREAMEAVSATLIPIDLVLSDIMMPGHTGPEVAARVLEVRPGTPVLLMSGYAEDYLGGVLKDAARYPVITKPFSGSVLTARLAAMIQTARAQQV